MPKTLPIARMAPKPGGSVEHSGFEIGPLNPRIARANSAAVSEAASTASAYDGIITALETAQATIATYEPDMANGDEVGCRAMLADIISDLEAFKAKWNEKAEREGR